MDGSIASVIKRADCYIVFMGRFIAFYDGWFYTLFNYFTAGILSTVSILIKKTVDR